jgi:hypothetical protein
MAPARIRLPHGLALGLLLAGAMAQAAPAETTSDAPVPAAQGASKPRPAVPKDGGDKPMPAERIDPPAIDLGASYPGPRRRVFPAE